MYSPEQKESHIREVQRYLREISKKVAEIPQISVDGVFDPNTKIAVISFQKYCKIPETGEVDSVTWDLLVKYYLEFKPTEPKGVNAFCAVNDGVLQVGDKCSCVTILNAMLDEIGDHQTNIPHVPHSGELYTTDTAECVRQIQNLSGLPPTGQTDVDTWNTIADLYENSVKLQNKVLL
jgi:peptidoglycan hydrolase-like protein with peptidoglycan-binding domain